MRKKKPAPTAAVGNVSVVEHPVQMPCDTKSLHQEFLTPVNYTL